MRVAVIGLGLIGGSLARDLAAAGHEVMGFDQSAATLRSARRAKVLAGVLGPRFDGIDHCDSCVIAVPVDVAVATLEAAAPRLANVPLVTDVGSTKVSIVRAAERLGLGKRFVGAHPLAGDHESGWPASRVGLFAAQRVYLTRTRETTPAALHRARRLWTSVGARVVMIAPAAHDELLAATSHLPQVTALALAMLLGDARISRDELGRGGRDMTRLAASNPDVWAGILADNSEHVAARIARLRKALRQIESSIATGDRAALRRLLSLTNAWSRK